MKEFREWLNRNPEISASRTLEEIAELAVAAGYDRQAIAQWLIHEKFVRAA